MREVRPRIGRPARAIVAPQAAPMHWWPRQTPRNGVAAPGPGMTAVRARALRGVRHDAVARRDCLAVGGRQRVVAAEGGLVAALANVARQVMHERVVVIDEQDHLNTSMMPRALSSVSRYSWSGSESAMMPPPA